MKILKRDNAPDLAFVQSERLDSLPTIMFLGGFCSDMEGTKAVYLEQQCQLRNQSYVRFDYRGHGRSEGRFEEACISDWAQDAIDILDHCAPSGPVVLVGSSMGGWLSFLAALKRSEQVKAVIGLAAAPDFTTWMEEGMNDAQKKDVQAQGYFELSNDYDDKPYIITKKLLEDGRQNSFLKTGIDLNIPIHLIQGKKDADVPWRTAESIKQAIQSGDIQITYIDEADHRLSSPDQLDVLGKIVEKYSKI